MGILKESSLDLTWVRAHTPAFDSPARDVGAMSASDQYLTEPTTIRPAAPPDLPAIARLAELDSARVPRGSVLVAELRGNVVAAISLESGALVADPFAATADAVKVLRAKAAATAVAGGPELRRRGTSLVARVREIRRRRQLGLRTTN
jgi:hypothetical protein